MQNETEASSPASQLLDPERLQERLAISELALSLMEMNVVMESLWPLIVSRIGDEDASRVDAARRYLDSAFERAKGAGDVLSGRVK